jgi:hypothetical protein
LFSSSCVSLLSSFFNSSSASSTSSVACFTVYSALRTLNLRWSNCSSNDS